MRPSARMYLALAMVLAPSGGCAPAAAPAAAPEATPRRDTNLITTDELRDIRFATIYDAVRLLKGQWLIERNLDDLSSSGPTMQVYLDDVRVGGVDALRDIPAKNAAYVRHIDGTRAMARWGRGHERGVILVATRADFVPDE